MTVRQHNIYACLTPLPPCHAASFHRLSAEWPSRFRAQAAHLGVRWPRGVLLQGPSGTGKTSAVTALARECGAELHTVTAAAVFGAFQGEVTPLHSLA